MVRGYHNAIFSQTCSGELINLWMRFFFRTNRFVLIGSSGVDDLLLDSSSANLPALSEAAMSNGMEVDLDIPDGGVDVA